MYVYSYTSNFHPNRKHFTKIIPNNIRMRVLSHILHNMHVANVVKKSEPHSLPFFFYHNSQLPERS